MSVRPFTAASVTVSASTCRPRHHHHGLLVVTNLVPALILRHLACRLALRLGQLRSRVAAHRPALGLLSGTREPRIGGSLCLERGVGELLPRLCPRRFRLPLLQLVHGLAWPLLILLGQHLILQLPRPPSQLLQSPLRRRPPSRGGQLRTAMPPLLLMRYPLSPEGREGRQIGRIRAGWSGSESRVDMRPTAPHR